MRDLDPVLILPDQSAPSDHPAKGPLDDPAPRQHLEALLLITAPNDEIQIACLVHELEAVIGAIGEDMFNPARACGT